MFFRLLLLFTVVPVVELWLLVQIAARITPFRTFVLVLLTGIVGAWLARWQGWRAVRRIRDELDAGRMPTEPLLDGLLILVAGVVLVTPGVLTDAIGFLLLIPPYRQLVKRWLKRRFLARFTVDSSRGGDVRWLAGSDNPFDHDRVIEARVIEPESSSEDEEEDAT